MPRIKGEIRLIETTVPVQKGQIARAIQVFEALGFKEAAIEEKRIVMSHPSRPGLYWVILSELPDVRPCSGVAVIGFQILGGVDDAVSKLMKADQKSGRIHGLADGQGVNLELPDIFPDLIHLEN